jgi:ABC-type branched-subunit amino acid transport system substrate-binding protein
MELAVRMLNGAGGVRGQRVELLFEDTKGDPGAGIASFSSLSQRGVHAVVGEFHSVVANAVVERLDSVGFPIIFSSPTLDAITARRLHRVFRLTLPQSRGWRLYAAVLAARGIRHVIALMQDSLYWNAGAQVMEDRLRKSNVRFTRVPWENGGLLQRIREAREMMEPAALLLLLAYPQPLGSALQQLRPERLAGLMCGDPAGRPVFSDWWNVAGEEGVGVPFLAYQRPKQLAPTGSRFAAEFVRQYAREPTFVALEGYDSVLAVATAIDAAESLNAKDICASLRNVAIQGTRGEIRFSSESEGVVHQQWKWPPACVVAFHRVRDRFANVEMLWDADTDGYDP